MKYESLTKKCNLFFSLASVNISDVKIDNSGMRNESFDLVRNQRNSEVKMKPIEISVYPDVGAILQDGRHRLAVAKELGDKSIEALVRYYDEEGNVVDKYLTVLPLN